MMSTLPPPPPSDECQCSLALVWDGDLNAMAITGRGTPIQVGPAANLSSHDLLAMAASTSLMAALLALAQDAGISVHGYVSSARVRDAGGRLTMALAPCIVVHSSAERMQLDALWRRAVEHSPMLRLFGDALQIELSVRAVSAA
jgi:hypothetical protein